MRSIDREKLKNLREQHNWTQRQLAELSGVASTVVSRLENGNQKDCRVSALVSIASMLGVTVDSLLEDQSIEKLQGLIPELRILITQLSNEPDSVQRNAVGILRGLLSSYG